MRRAVLARRRDLYARGPSYRRRFLRLRREAVVVHHERVYRVYRGEGLTVRIKRRKRLAATPRASLAVPNARATGTSFAF